MKIFEDENLIINDAEEIDWKMHASTKPVKVAGKSDSNDLSKLLDKGTEYIDIKDYKSDKEYEKVIMFKYEGKYFFATKCGLIEE